MDSNLGEVGGLWDVSCPFGMSRCSHFKERYVSFCYLGRWFRWCPSAALSRSSGLVVIILRSVALENRESEEFRLLRIEVEFDVLGFWDSAVKALR
ncbi:hypothetical protein Tco_0270937 [Tanacetum coccineum]